MKGVHTMRKKQVLELAQLVADGINEELYGLKKDVQEIKEGVKALREQDKIDNTYMTIKNKIAENNWSLLSFTTEDNKDQEDLYSDLFKE